MESIVLVLNPQEAKRLGLVTGWTLAVIPKLEDLADFVGIVDETRRLKDFELYSRFNQ